MRKVDRFTKVMLAVIAAGLWVLILRPVVVPGSVRAAAGKQVPVAKVLRAERFEVVDSSGKVRAALETLPDGSPGLTLRDKDGQMRAWLSLLPDGSPGLTLRDKDGQMRAGLLLSNGSPGLSLWGKDGKGGAMLAVRADGSPELALYDKDGRLVWQTP